MSSLWRTQRPRFPSYIPDGRGRDYYIKFDNGGYWASQFNLKKKPDYERHLYKNFHTLFHQAAPFKYWGNGHGRETYILKTNGLFHDQKPLCSYKLSDFLRGGELSSRHSFRKKLFMSVSEKKYNDKLKKFEKKLIERLYTEPMNMKKIFIKKDYQISLDNDYVNTSGSNNKININKNMNNEESKNNNISIEGYKNKNRYENDKNFKKGFNTICNFYNNKERKKKYMTIQTEGEDSVKFKHVNDKTFNKYFDYNKTITGFNSKMPRNEFKFVDPKERFNRRMKCTFNFKPKPKIDKIKIKKLHIDL